MVFLYLQILRCHLDNQFPDKSFLQARQHQNQRLSSPHRQSLTFRARQKHGYQHWHVYHDGYIHQQ